MESYVPTSTSTSTSTPSIPHRILLSNPPAPSFPYTSILQILLRPTGPPSLIHHIGARQRELDTDDGEEEEAHARGGGGDD